ncbi:unnamed protein product [Peronospora destructor]|uniref:Glycine-rich protein n=1 Tax=Peronospora destructor TaxID=86335 RepID=A0AAV0THD5_9STRA|nr:unnamed protein product [Peronospora destructor]
MFTSSKFIAVCLAVAALSNGVYAEKEAAQTFGHLGMGPYGGGVYGAGMYGPGDGYGGGYGGLGEGDGYGTGVNGVGLGNRYDVTC